MPKISEYANGNPPVDADQVVIARAGANRSITWANIKATLKTYFDTLYSFDSLTLEGASIAAASTTNIGAATGYELTVTGNTTITSFGTAAAGIFRVLKFSGTPLLTYNATSLKLPGAANYKVVAGDTLTFVSEGSGNWKCVGYALINTAPLIIASGTYTPTLTNTTNVAASTAFVCQYMRVGNVVTVSGQVQIDTTSAAATLLEMSLPIASDFITASQCGGTAANLNAAAQESAGIQGVTANDTAGFNFLAIATANQNWFFSFTYLIN